MTRGFTKPPASVSRSIPTDFPSDVPIPPGAKCEESSKIGDSIHLDLVVNQPVPEILRFYERQLPAQGWAVGLMGDDMKEDKAEEGVIGAKNGHSVSAIVAPLEDGSSELKLLVR